MSSKHYTDAFRYIVESNTMNMRPIILGTPIEVDNTNRIEVKMEESKELVEIKLKNLNEAYVIVKRYNGGVYFKRTQYVTDVKSFPTKECLYYTKEEADNKVLLLNTNRQKCKYSVENAGKYFINMYQATIDTWGDTKVTIKNEAVSIKNFEAGKYNKSYLRASIEEALKATKEQLASKIEHNSLRAKTVRDELPLKIEQLKQTSEEEARSYMSECEKFTLAQNKVQGITNQSFKEYETQGDRIARVLYAKSETTTKSNSTTARADDIF